MKERGWDVGCYWWKTVYFQRIDKDHLETVAEYDNAGDNDSSVSTHLLL